MKTDAELESMILQISADGLEDYVAVEQTIMYELFRRYKELRRDHDVLEKMIYHRLQAISIATNTKR